MSKFISRLSCHSIDSIQSGVQIVLTPSAITPPVYSAKQYGTMATSMPQSSSCTLHITVWCARLHSGTTMEQLVTVCNVGAISLALHRTNWKPCTLCWIEHSALLLRQTFQISFNKWQKKRRLVCETFDHWGDPLPPTLWVHIPGMYVCRNNIFCYN